MADNGYWFTFLKPQAPPASRSTGIVTTKLSLLRDEEHCAAARSMTVRAYRCRRGRRRLASRTKWPWRGASRSCRIWRRRCCSLPPNGRTGRAWRGVRPGRRRHWWWHQPYWHCDSMNLLRLVRYVYLLYSSLCSDDGWALGRMAYIGRPTGKIRWERRVGASCSWHPTTTTITTCNGVFRTARVTWRRRESRRNGGSGLSVYDYKISHLPKSHLGSGHRVTANDCRRQANKILSNDHRVTRIRSWGGLRKVRPRAVVNQDLASRYIF
jgi:hypothetical protein